MGRQIFAMTFSVWLTVLPLFSNAQQQSEPLSKWSPEKAVTTTKVDSSNSSYINVTARDQNGKEFQFQLPKSSPQELEPFSPKQLNAKFLQEMAGGKISNLQALKASTMRFPMEAGMFFVAIGAVTALQIFTDYSSNPVRMQQHVENSLSPIGIFSFYMFLSTNGVTANALSTILKNPRYHHMIPYLSMTAGYFVQSVVSTFAADPNVKACVGQILGKKAEKDQASVNQETVSNPCQAAFSWYSLKGKAYELTPGLISMLASNFVTYQAQMLLVKGFAKYLAIDIAFLFFPGGLGVQSVRFMISNAIQMGVFYYIDVAWLNHFFTFNFKNIYDGSHIAKLDHELTQKILRKKKTGWKDSATGIFCSIADPKDCASRDLSENLKELQQSLANWRMINLMKVYEAHMSWQELLASFNTQHESTKNFYFDLVDEVRNSKWKFTQPLKLDAADPLFGVTARDLEESRSDMYYHKPHFTSEMASESARVVGQKIQDKIKNKDYQNLDFYPVEIQSLHQISVHLTSSDMSTQGKGVGLLNKLYQEAIAGSVLSPEYLSELQAIALDLGKGARPLMAPGEGFFSRYERWSPNAKTLKETSFPKSSGAFATPRQVDYLAVQSLCGPDVSRNESVLNLKAGSRAQFTPPRLVNSDQLVCEGSGEQDASMIHRFPVGGLTSQKGTAAALKAFLKAEILGTEESSGFNAWWSKQIEGQIESKYKEFEKSYENIILQLMSALKMETNAKSNAGPAPNGVLHSLRQQMRLDLVVLGEILKDLGDQQIPGGLPNNFYSTKKEPSPIDWRPVNYGIKNESMTSLLKGLASDLTPKNRYVSPAATSVFEFNRHSSLFAKDALPSKGRALQIQKEVEYEFERLFHLVQRLKTIQQGDEVRVSGGFENSDFEEHLRRIGEKVEKLGQLLGANEQTLGERLVTLPSGEIKNVVRGALEDLITIAQETVTYGTMINAVSWEKTHGPQATAAGAAAEAMMNKAQQQAQQLGGSLLKMGRSQ